MKNIYDTKLYYPVLLDTKNNSDIQPEAMQPEIELIKMVQQGIKEENK